MAVLLFAEHDEGKFKKAVEETATYAYDLAQKMGTELIAVAVGQVTDEQLSTLGEYGVSKAYVIRSEDETAFVNAAYARAIAQIADQIETPVVVMAETYTGRAIAPRVAVKLDATPMPGVIEMVDPEAHFDTTRMSYSGKGVQELQAKKDRVVITIKNNSYGVRTNPTEIEIAQFELDLDLDDIDVVAKEIVKVSEGIALTEAEKVISAGRGLKGPENWPMIEELAQLIGAATACSKPVADMEWRPHHEHVGQTGIQISPNLYVAIGISGAIQHLAGVSSSKHIVVINKDPEAPFFKIADYGIVGDLFEVVPKLIESIKTAKASV